LLSPKESKKSLELAVNSWKTRTALAPKIGKGKYVLAEYEKIKFKKKNSCLKLIENY
jgi:hypothetical protein